MKGYHFFYWLLAISLIFGACSKDDNKQYYSVLGTVEKSDDSTFVISDLDERLWVKNSGSLSEINNNDRIIAYFSISEEVKPAGVDLVIEVYNFNKVLFKPVIELTNADSIGNDPLRVREIWIAKDYLNLNFEYLANNPGIVHYINLTRAPGEIPTDTVELEIRHNAKDDAQINLSNGFVTFKLESLKVGSDSVILRVKAREFNDRSFQKDFTYKF